MSKKVKFVNGSLIEYDILDLVDFYDPILREPTIPWEHKKYDPKESEYLAYTMAETLVHHGGLGLSANQVGLKHRICVINMGGEIWTMFNPVILEKGLTPATYQEGCLSYPGLFLKVPRSNHIKVKFEAIYGQEVIQEFDGLTAVCIQHEIDHLDGIVYTDKVSSIKLDQAKRKVKKNLKKMKAMTKQHALLEKQETEMQKQGTIALAAKKDPDKFVYSTG